MFPWPLFTAFTYFLYLGNSVVWAFLSKIFWAHLNSYTKKEKFSFFLFFFVFLTTSSSYHASFFPNYSWKYTYPSDDLTWFELIPFFVFFTFSCSFHVLVKFTYLFLLAIEYWFTVYIFGTEIDKEWKCISCPLFWYI